MAAGAAGGGSADAHLALTLLGPASSVKTVKSVKSSFLEEPEGSIAKIE